jgi:hypothetical protein
MLKHPVSKPIPIFADKPSVVGNALPTTTPNNTPASHSIGSSKTHSIHRWFSVADVSATNDISYKKW